MPCHWLRGPHESSREWVRKELWGEEGKKGQRCLLGPEHLHIPVVLPPAFSPPDKMLNHFVGRGSLGVKACQWREMQRAALEKAT